MIGLADPNVGAIDLVEKFAIKNAPVNLRSEEICLYCGSARGAVIKTRVTGYEGAHKGTSIRIMKGVTYHTGGSKGQPIRQQVMESSFPGDFIMTNLRLLLLTTQYGFEIAGEKLQSIEMNPEGLLIYDTKSKPHIVLTDDTEKITFLFKLLNNEGKEWKRKKALEEPAKKQTSRKKASSEKTNGTSDVTEQRRLVSGADEIRKYKALLDEGIITEDEFEKVKVKLLEL